MQGQVSDRLVVHGSRASRAGVIVAVTGAHSYRVRWEDGRESMISPGPDALITHDEAAELRAEWEAAKAARQARTQRWRTGITAGVGREASLAQRKIGTLGSS